MEEIMGKLQQEQVEAAPTEVEAGAQGVQQATEPEKKYTDQDLDRIIAKKIAAERKRMSKIFNEEQQLSDIEIRERNVQQRELKADFKDMLIDRGLHPAFADILHVSDKAEAEKAIDLLDQCFQEALGREIKRRFRGEAPKRGSTSHGGDDPVSAAFKPPVR